ncbi:MAG: hypothetical protein LIR50_06830 [Bacillota bacterium]|nr:hypothetical protein [Bacillota bacterium]
MEVDNARIYKNGIIENITKTLYNLSLGDHGWSVTTTKNILLNESVTTIVDSYAPHATAELSESIPDDAEIIYVTFNNIEYEL